MQVLHAARIVILTLIVHRINDVDGPTTTKTTLIGLSGDCQPRPRSRDRQETIQQAVSNNMSRRMKGIPIRHYCFDVLFTRFLLFVIVVVFSKNKSNNDNNYNNKNNNINDSIVSYLLRRTPSLLFLQTLQSILPQHCHVPISYT